MADLHPFRPLAYAPPGRDLSDLLCPPYDVLDREEVEALRDRHEHNSVRITLPAGSEPHGRAGRRLEAWVRGGVLERRPREALYLYEQEYSRGGERRTRRGVFGALDLAPLDSGEVLPHEETHRGPKEDRLELTEATGAQLSPVFLVARDPDGAARSALEAVDPGPTVGRGRTPDGQRHRVRELAPGDRTRRLRRALTRHPLLIADGHHRYETALRVAERRGDEWPGADGVLACVVGERDPGLLVQPTHRALTRPPPAAEGWGEALRERFELRPAGGVTGPEDAEERARSATSALTMVVVPAGSRRALRATPRPSALSEVGLGGEEVASLAFSRLVLRALYGIGDGAAAERGLLSYRRDPAAALEAAGAEGAAFYLPPPGVDAVWRVARDGRRLPPKTTYFWPKLPTGLLYRDLTGGGAGGGGDAAVGRSR